MKRVIALLVLFCLGSVAIAEELQIVQRQVELDFEPESAFFLLRDDSTTKQAADSWIQNSENHQWVFGVYHKPVKASALMVFGIIMMLPGMIHLVILKPLLIYI